MRMRDIIVGTVVTLILVAVVAWVAVSIYQHENTGRAAGSYSYAAAG